ncbi:MAG: hypothetical protein ABIH03_04990 [Pseudomonadota bacterium]
MTTSKVWNGGEITRDMYAEMQQAMLQSAESVAAKARQLAPVGRGDPMHLRDTIRAVGRRKRSRLEVLAHGLASGDYETALPGAWVFAGARDKRVYWAHWVEYGTYDTPGQPYLRPAVDANFNATVAHAERAGRRVILKRRRARAAARRAAG